MGNKATETTASRQPRVALTDRKHLELPTPIHDELVKLTARCRYLHDGKPSVKKLLEAISRLSHRHVEEMLDDAELLPTPYGHGSEDEEENDYTMPDC